MLAEFRASRQAHIESLKNIASSFASPTPAAPERKNTELSSAATAMNYKKDKKDENKHNENKYI